MSQWLEGKVAVVTGGSAGIGRAIVKRFVSEGARVCVMARSPGPLAALQAELGAAITTSRGSVDRLADNQAAVERAVRTFGTLDVFVGNAGIFDCFATLEKLPPEAIDAAFDQIFAVNTKGPLLGAKAALPALRERGGSLIFSLSNAAFYPDGGGPIYTASKHAVVGLVRELALELAPISVRVNGVAPGGTTTEIAGPPALAALCAQRAMGAARDALIRSRTPLGFAQQPEDHTAAYVLLASDQARAITGTVIESDGGVGIRGMSRA